MQIESQSICIDELQGEQKQKSKQYIIKVNSRSNLFQEGEYDVERKRPYHFGIIFNFLEFLVFILPRN